jgi:hypothetical protein
MKSCTELLILFFLSNLRVSTLWLTLSSSRTVCISVECEQKVIDRQALIWGCDELCFPHLLVPKPQPKNSFCRREHNFSLERNGKKRGQEPRELAKASKDLLRMGNPIITTHRFTISANDDNAFIRKKPSNDLGPFAQDRKERLLLG